MPRPCNVLWLIAILLGASACEARPPETCTVAQVGGRPLELELLVPEGPGPHPVLVWVHGGGWVGGNHQRFPGFTAPALKAGIARLNPTRLIAV